MSKQCWAEKILRTLNKSKEVGIVSPCFGCFDISPRLKLNISYLVAPKPSMFDIHQLTKFTQDLVNQIKESTGYLPNPLNDSKEPISTPIIYMNDPVQLFQAGIVTYRDLRDKAVRHNQFESYSLENIPKFWQNFNLSSFENSTKKNLPIEERVHLVVYPSVELVRHISQSRKFNSGNYTWVDKKLFDRFRGY